MPLFTEGPRRVGHLSPLPRYHSAAIVHATGHFKKCARCLLAAVWEKPTELRFCLYCTGNQKLNPTCCMTNGSKGQTRKAITATDHTTGTL